jgi:uncharacterized membrane protein YqjE
VARGAGLATLAVMSQEPNSHHVPTWKFVAALAAMLVLVTLGTLFWMWRDARPRRRPALLGKPEPMWSQPAATNQPATNATR